MQTLKSTELNYAQNNAQLLLGIQSNFIEKSRHFLFMDTKRKLNKSEQHKLAKRLTLLGYSRMLIFNSGKSNWVISFIPRTFRQTRTRYCKLPYKDMQHYKIGIKDKYWVIRITPKNSTQIRLKRIISNGFCKHYNYSAEQIFFSSSGLMRQ